MHHFVIANTKIRYVQERFENVGTRSFNVPRDIARLLRILGLPSYTRGYARPTLPPGVEAGITDDFVIDECPLRCTAQHLRCQNSPRIQELRFQIAGESDPGIRGTLEELLDVELHRCDEAFLTCMANCRNR